MKPDDPNRLGKFDFELLTPNQWSGVMLEIKGQPDKDGQPAGRRRQRLQALLGAGLYTTGIATVRVESLSRGLGRDNTAQPADDLHAQARPQHLSRRAEEVRAAVLGDRHRSIRRTSLKNLTAVTISAYCDDCRPSKGMLIVDNVVFEK